MDLAGMINNGVEALHRGSVDKSGEASPQSPAVTPQNRRAPQEIGSRRPNRTAPQAFPRYAGVFRGTQNRVRDVRRARLSETRPELAAVFASSSYERHDDDDDDEEAAFEAGAERHAGESSSHDEDDGIVDSKDTHSRHAPAAGRKGAGASALGATPFSNLRFPPPTATEIGPGGNVSLTGLTASLAGLIPNDDQTQTLAGWLFEKIQTVKDHTLLEHLEIEFKMGLIADEHSGLRHRFPMLSEAVVDPGYFSQQRLKFKSEVDDARFKSLESLLDKLAVANAGSGPSSISRENILSRDAVYHFGSRTNQKPNSVRVSFDDHDRVLECITKQRIGDLFIKIPNGAYDLKMSLSIEHPVDFASVAADIKATQPSFERSKNRLRWQSSGCSVDITSVHGQGSHGRPALTKEAEVEASGTMLGSVLQEYYESSDKALALDKFLELVRYTMDSARFLVRNI